MKMKSDISEIIPTISTDCYYSPFAIARKKFIPWAIDYHTILRICKSGALKAVKIEGIDECGNRWQVSGKNLIKYLKKYETRK